MNVSFVARAEIEVPLPEPVRTMHLGWGDKNRVRFQVQYDADQPEEAQRILDDALRQVAASLLAAVQGDAEESPKPPRGAEESGPRR